jgi:hypothetical protein
MIKRNIAIISFVVGFAGTVGIATAVSACKGALPPIFQTVENKVLADIEAGDGLPQIEADVNALIPGLQSVEEFVQSIITILIETKVLSPTALVRAKSYKLTLMTVTAHK